MAIQQILAKPGAKVMAKLKISNGAVAMFCRDLLHLKAGKPLLSPPFFVGSSHSFCSRPPPPEGGGPCGCAPPDRTTTPDWATAVRSIRSPSPRVRSLSLSRSVTTGWATAAAPADAQRQVPRPSSVSSLVTSIRQVFPTFLFPCRCAKPSTQTLT